MRFRTVFAIGVSTLAVVGSAGLVMRVRAAGEWRALSERADAVRTSYESRRVPRAALRGDAVEGSAFLHYDRAVLLGTELGWGRDLVPHRLSSPDEEQRAVRTELAREVAPVFEELALGARASDARLPVDWETGADHPVDHDHKGTYVCDLAAMVALSELDAGRAAEATDVLLDSLQYARDLIDAPTLFEAREGARALVSQGLVAFGEQGGWSRLPGEQRARVERALERIDEDLATIGDSLEVHEAVRLAQASSEVLQAEVDSAPLRSLLLLLLPFFQELQAEEVHLLLDFTRDYRALHERAPLRALETTERRYRARANDERKRFLLDLHAESASMRLRALARLRLLRYGLAVLADREDAPAEDRLGYPIRATSADGTLRVDLETPCFTGLVLELPVD